MILIGPKGEKYSLVKLYPIQRDVIGFTRLISMTHCLGKVSDCWYPKNIPFFYKYFIIKCSYNQMLSTQ